MKITSASLIYFSPTGTTRKIVTRIAQGLEIRNISDLDLTLDPEAVGPVQTDLAILGAPVYGGRLPIPAIERMQQVKGKATPAIVVVLYGNRAYEDALLELKNLALANGFIPLAAGAFVGEHSYSTEARPLAKGRPDAADLDTAFGFGRQIGDKLAAINALPSPEVLTVPGNASYKERHPPMRQSPVTQVDLCTLCGTCATVCPTRVITVDDTAVTTDQSGCIACCACIKSCPTQARIYTVSRISEINQWLYDNFSARKEPELFL